MADAAARPQIVANLVPNQWSVIHFDIIVKNTGNACALWKIGVGHRISPSSRKSVSDTELARLRKIGV
jgi:hypothetical protein